MEEIVLLTTHGVIARSAGTFARSSGAGAAPGASLALRGGSLSVSDDQQTVFVFGLAHYDSSDKRYSPDHFGYALNLRSEDIWVNPNLQNVQISMLAHATSSGLHVGVREDYSSRDNTLMLIRNEEVLWSVQSSIGGISRDGSMMAYYDSFRDIVLARIEDGTVTEIGEIDVSNADVEDSRDIDQLLLTDSGDTLALIRDTHVYVYDASSGEIAQHLAWHDSSITASAFSPDGKSLLVGCASGVIKLWSTATGQTQGVWETDGAIVSLDWLQHETFLAVSNSGGIARFHREKELPEAMLPGIGNIDSMRYLDSHTLLLLDVPENRMLVWDTLTALPWKVIDIPSTLSPCSIYLQVSGGNIAILPYYDPASLLVICIDSEEYTQYESGSAVGCIVSCNSRCRCLAVIDDHLELLDLHTGQSRMVSDNRAFNAVALSNDSGLAAFSVYNEGIFIMDSSTGKIVEQIGEAAGSYVKLEFSPDDKFLLAVSDRRREDLDCWETGRWSKLFNIDYGTYDARFSADGSAFYSAQEIYSFASTDVMLRFSERPDGFEFSPDGESIAVLEDDVVYLIKLGVDTLSAGKQIQLWLDKSDGSSARELLDKIWTQVLETDFGTLMAKHSKLEADLEDMQLQIAEGVLGQEQYEQVEEERRLELSVGLLGVWRAVLGKLYTMFAEREFDSSRQAWTDYLARTTSEYEAKVLPLISVGGEASRIQHELSKFLVDLNLIVQSKLHEELRHSVAASQESRTVFAPRSSVLWMLLEFDRQLNEDSIAEEALRWAN